VTDTSSVQGVQQVLEVGSRSGFWNIVFYYLKIL